MKKSLRAKAASLLALTLARSFLAAVTIIALVVGFVVVRFGMGRSPGTSAAEGTSMAMPTPSCGPPRCRTITPQKFTTLADAAAQASFDPRLPSYIPPGFQAYSFEFTRFAAEPPIHKEVHNDWITVYYRDAAGHELVVSQGFPAMFAFVTDLSPDSLYQRAPEDAKGRVNVNGMDAYWLRGEPWPPGPDSRNPAFIPDPAFSKSGGLVLAWEVGRFGPGWEISPDRIEVLTGSPFSYSITSDVLSLEELKRIAGSVSIGSDSFP